MNEQVAIQHLLNATETHLRNDAYRLAQTDHRDLALRFAEELRDEFDRPSVLSNTPSHPVRGLRHAPVLFDDASCPPQNLFEAALRAFPYARWSEFYEETIWSQSFISNFATGECVGPSGRLHSDHVILGLFMLGPETHYPAHAHAAEEFYIVIAGEAEFQGGVASDFIIKRPGDVILHASNMSHAIRTSSKPLFAVYGWRGALSEPSWYRDDMADENESKKFPAFAKTIPKMKMRTAGAFFF